MVEDSEPEPSMAEILLPYYPAAITVLTVILILVLYKIYKRCKKTRTA